MNLEPLELAVLQKLLDGDHPVFIALRDQMIGLSVTARKLTGAGFFTEFSTTANARPATVPSGKARFGDVEATISGLERGAGFLLYVDQGLLNRLEGYSYEEPWPERIHEFSLKYVGPDRKEVLAAFG
jgi:hypothetical protein